MDSIKISLDHRTLVFVHIARSGGTTLTNLLDTHFANDRILKAHLVHKEGDQVKGIAGHSGRATTEPGDLAKYRLITGHINFGDLDGIVADPVYITMLRDPVERVVSLYSYWRSHKAEYIDKHDLRGPRLAKDLSLRDFIDSDLPEARHNVNNGMARQLLGGLVAPIDLPDADFLRLARDRLNRFAFVGFTELFDLSIDLLCYTLGWEPPAETEDANRFEQNVLDSAIFEPIERQRPAEETVARILEHNRVDRALYRSALGTFQRRCRAMNRELARDPASVRGRKPVVLKRIARRLNCALTNYVHPQEP